MKHNTDTKTKETIKNILFVSSLFFTQSCFASIVLDLSGKDLKGLYNNVEIKHEEGNAYSVHVTRATQDGPAVTIYEGSVIKEVLKDGVLQYRDTRLRVVDQGNGKAFLRLNNGENIQVQLGE
ncbi:MAG: hypothetical protein AABY64_12300 [Bdellovibrionota bacterium]